MPARLDISDEERRERRRLQRLAAERRRKARNPEHVRRLARESHARNKHKRPAQNRFRSYGLTPEQYAARLAAQNGCCAVCGTDSPGRANHSWYVDHDHNTGRVRGLLCLTCNAGIGQFRDAPSLLRAAAFYLEK